MFLSGKFARLCKDVQDYCDRECVDGMSILHKLGTPSYEGVFAPYSRLSFLDRVERHFIGLGSLLVRAAVNGQYNLVEMLILDGEQVDIEIFFNIISSGNLRAVKYILSIGLFDVDVQDDHGLTALDRIAISQQGYKPLARLLRSLGAQDIFWDDTQPKPDIQESYANRYYIYFSRSLTHKLLREVYIGWSRR